MYIDPFNPTPLQGRQLYYHHPPNFIDKETETQQPLAHILGPMTMKKPGFTPKQSGSTFLMAELYCNRLETRYFKMETSYPYGT